MESFDELFRLFLVSEVHLKDLAEAPEGCEEPEAVPGLKIATGKVNHAKCSRCWNRDAAVGSFDDHPELCPRCHAVVTKAGFTGEASEGTA